MSTAKVVKKVKEVKATGFVFFSLINEDDIIEYQGPRSKFISGDCGDQIPDPDTMMDFIEVYGEEKSKVLNSTADWQFIDFSEVECDDCTGRISVASINPQDGLIFIKREGVISKDDVLPLDDDEAIEDELLFYDFDLVEDYNLKSFQNKMSVLDWERRRRKGEYRKPRRDNRKTMPDNKVQRDNRALLGLVKIRCVEEENFYEKTALFSYDSPDSLFSEMEFYDYDEEFECA